MKLFYETLTQSVKKLPLLMHMKMKAYVCVSSCSNNLYFHSREEDGHFCTQVPSNSEKAGQACHFRPDETSHANVLSRDSEV